MSDKLCLAIAIAAEVIATSALQSSNGFSRLFPALAAVVGYVIAFYSLSLALRSIPLGVAYAIWSGVGIACLALIGWVVYRQRLDLASIAGIMLIFAGVVILQWSRG